jgi:4-hydroxy-tetrahydrodipicolinate reductase
VKPINVMVNGGGNMAKVVSEHIITDKRFELVPYALVGDDYPEEQFSIAGKKINAIFPNKAAESMKSLKPLYDMSSNGSVVCIDYTHPDAVIPNAKLYASNGLPVVFGTTGGNRGELMEILGKSSAPSVVAPNMAAEIVAFQAMLEFAAKSFPGLFDGFSLKICESHQKGKADTSGTAKAAVKSFNALGIKFLVDDIVKMRDPMLQVAYLGVPARYLGGHGWHQYELVSSDGTVKLGFEHNINGRDPYAKGSLRAVIFLNKMFQKGTSGVYSMIDVISAPEE